MTDYLPLDTRSHHQWLAPERPADTAPVLALIDLLTRMLAERKRAADG
jgi:hypothetical protein